MPADGELLGNRHVKLSHTGYIVLAWQAIVSERGSL